MANVDKSRNFESFLRDNRPRNRVCYLPKRNQSSLLFLHSIMVAMTACTISSSTCVLAFRQHSRTATHPYTSVTHSPKLVARPIDQGGICVYVNVRVRILTVVLLPVDDPSGGQSNKGLSVFCGHGGAEHLERAQFAARHRHQTDPTQSIFNIGHNG